MLPICCCLFKSRLHDMHAVTYYRQTQKTSYSMLFVLLTICVDVNVMAEIILYYYNAGFSSCNPQVPHYGCCIHLVVIM